MNTVAPTAEKTALRRKRFLLFPLAALLLLSPLAFVLAWGTVDFSDLTFYSLAPTLFDAQFWHGELYPRWLMEGNAGYGSPVFFFYPPVAAYLMAPLAFLSPLDPDGTWRLFASMVLATAVSAFTAFGWLRQKFPAREAFSGALVYVLLPFRLIYTYLDFNLAQCWALAWFPLVLGAQEGIIARRPYAVPMMAAAVALLAFTHVPSVVTFLPLIPWLAVTAAPGNRLRVLAQSMAALLLGLGGAALYLLPMELNQGAIDMHGLLQDLRYQYAYNFMSVKFLVSIPFIVVFLACIYRKADTGERRALWPWYVFAAGLIFMMTPFSKPIWDTFSFMRYLQFPVSRFYAPLLPVLAVIFTYGLRHYRLCDARFILPVLLGSAALCIGFMRPIDFTLHQEVTAAYTAKFLLRFYTPLCGALILAALYFRLRRKPIPLAHFLVAAFLYSHVAYVYNFYRHNEWPKSASSGLENVMRMVRDTRIIPPPEYRPLSVDEGVIALQSLADLQPEAQTAELAASDGKARVLSWQPRRIGASADITSPSAPLTLKHFFFPGWTVLDNGALTATLPYASDHYGFLTIDLARGHHDLVFRLDQVRGEREGLFLSLVAALAFMCWVLYARRRTVISA